MEEQKICKNSNTKSLSTRPTSNNNITSTKKCGAKEEVKLAALVILLKAKLRSADMPFTMQERALCFTRSYLDAAPMNSTRLKPSPLACALKKEFDTRYGAAWHCIVGKSFGSYVTHSNGGFLYFSFDSLFVLLFQTRVHLLASTSHD